MWNSIRYMTVDRDERMSLFMIISIFFRLFSVAWLGCVSLNRYFVCISNIRYIILNNLRLHIIIIFLYQPIITSLRLPSDF